jgi:heme iron utilization protein
MAADAPEPTPQWQARQLLRAARVGTLATSADGQPFAALVTPATAPDLSPVLWLSSLSEHTRHLAAEPRCALLVAGPAADENPQTAPRLTVTGCAERIENSYLKSRWLAAHPYAALYADFADFSLWRIRLMGGHFVGGFARATRLRQTDLTPDPTAVAALEAAAPEILAHCNQDHPDTMANLGATLARAAGGAPGPWRMVAVDVDGCDLAHGQKILRIPFAAPVAGPEDVRRELIRLARVP